MPIYSTFPQGCPFTSKPEVAEFKDFTPGEIMKLKLTLTNVTYTVNYCKLVGVSTQLSDFITVKFNPPGAMSAGLTCQMVIIFEPKVHVYIPYTVFNSTVYIV